MLAQTATWVLGVLAGFLLPPPIGTPQESQVWVRFAQFVITVLIGLLVLAALRWERKKDAFRWGAISLLFLFLGTATFFGYQFFAARWTTTYNEQRVVIGDVYTAHGRGYHDENPNLPPADLIMDHKGEVEKIWTRESIAQRRLLLAAMYVLAMPLFTVCVMSIVQALHCAVAKTNRRRRVAASAHRTSH
ncbi:MAG: hypothetical protein HY298_15400 [Verrucomicrobia bacterium]|nr:hypothetical protein [Verrucomicrobiota bacterium]